MAGTILLPGEEQEFQQWYSAWAQKAGLPPSPDDPSSGYDYRGAWKAGAEPQVDPSSGNYQWPTEYQRPGTVPHMQADKHVEARYQDAVRSYAGSQAAPNAPASPSKPLSKGVGDLIPLTEYLKTRHPKTFVGPDLVRTPVESVIQQGARALIPKLQGPVELPAGQRSNLTRMTDAAPVGTQHATEMETAAPFYTGAPAIAPRPLEITTPREQTTRDEIDRILNLLDALHPDGGHA